MFKSKTEISKGCWFSLLLILITYGCREKPAQIADEYSGAGVIMLVLALYEAEFPTTSITNLSQAFEGTKTPYPARWHYLYRDYGTHAGFKNSIYEKYVVLSPGIRHPSVDGDIVLLNAEPFPNREGTSGRLIFFRKGKGYEAWRVEWYTERQVQQIFHDNGITIPKPASMPAPANLPQLDPEPINVKVQQYFNDVARNYGLGHSGELLMYATLALLAIPTLLLILLGWRRSH